MLAALEMKLRQLECHHQLDVALTQAQEREWERSGSEHLAVFHRRLQLSIFDF